MARREVTRITTCRQGHLREALGPCTLPVKFADPRSMGLKDLRELLAQGAARPPLTLPPVSAHGERHSSRRGP